MSFKQTYTLSHLCIGIFIISCFPLCSCSKPTKPLSPAEILEAMLNLPPYPSPPLTDENASNESYQLVADGCTGPELVLLSYKSWIQRLISKEIEAINIEGDWQWMLSEYGMIFTLTVVPKDTLTFVIDFEQYNQHRETNGWILPKGRAAEIITATEYVKWDRDDNDLWCTAKILQSIQRSFIASSGEGWRRAGVFYAEWDAHGHGYYTTGGQKYEW